MYKYIIVGNSCSGKSCLLCRYTDDNFEYSHDMTIGVEFGSKNILSDNYNIKLQIWDTAGQESFRSIISSYFRGAVGALVVFDITNQKSFNDVKIWIDEVNSKSHSPVTILLIGNKCDLEFERVVTRTEALNFANKYNIDYIETSAKSGLNVKFAFEFLTKKITDKVKNGIVSKDLVLSSLSRHSSLLEKKLIEEKEKPNNNKCYCG